MNAKLPFQLLRSQNVPALSINLEEYEHLATGARHFHLASENKENVFLVALRTVPMDSTGVAHILEHTALCGSEKYPVRDPFFMMIRRSLNTFMNAFTSSDWTAYPFASQNRKDFDNLLQVYMDAVFFSRLDPLDFAQEGHRLEFSEPDNPDSQLEFKGVVFNEMKGAMSAISSQLWHTLCKYVYPSTTYHYNSGGDPEHIPTLSYDKLLEFYRTHYHPSNAMFFTYGDIPAQEHQEKMEELALHRFQRLDETISVDDERRYSEPVRIVEHYPVEADSDADALHRKTHIVIGWLWGKSTVLEESLEAQFLANVLLDNSSSPLQQLLETTELGGAPSPVCGLEDSNRELCFCCGIESAAADSAQAFEDVVVQRLQEVCETGVPAEQLEAVLHQLEFHQREIGGDSYPYGLQIIMAALGSATHRGDPLDVLDIEPVLDKLRERIKDKNYVPSLIKKLLLDNQHRVTLEMQPDPNLAAIRDAGETARLEKIRQGMDDDAARKIVELAASLQQRQLQEDDSGVLPKVTLSDVPAGIKAVPQEELPARAEQMKMTFMPQGTNGIVYQQLVLPMPAFTAQELQLLPLFSTCLTELGTGERSYLETQALQAASCGSLSMFSSLRALPEDEQSLRAYLVLSGKALSRKSEALTELMVETLLQQRFDEQARILELIAQASARKEQSVTGAGHTLAMNAACSAMSPGAAISYQSSGMAGIRWLKALNAQPNIDNLCATLRGMHEKLVQQRRQALVIAEAEQKNALIEQMRTALGSGSEDSMHSFTPLRDRARLAWQTNTQVNFCAKAFPTVPSAHTDAAALTVLGGFLRNGFLHRAVREQGGAYGGGASQDSGSASFRFYSYRDPRLEETFADFDASIQWLLEHNHEPRQLEEAILGVIGSMDKPGSPAGEAKQQFHNDLFGRSIDKREAFRQAVLGVTLSDLQAVGERYFGAEADASVAVISNSTNLENSRDWVHAQSMTLEELA